VIVDVTVTDSHQNPVHNLKPSDFVILEDNVSQPVKSFEEHFASHEPTKPEELPHLPPGVFTNFTPVPPNSALNIVLLDTLNTPLADQAYVRDQLKHYLKNSPREARIAIFGLSTHLYLLQGFTSDPETLKTAVDRKGNLKSSPLLDDPVSGGSGPESLSDTLSDSFGNDPSMADTIANVQQFEAQNQSFQLQLRARYTLDALNQLARYLSGLPGRKNLIWFSGSFPINILPDGDLQNPFAVVASSEEEFRETTNLLTLSQVAVYPVDARGLMTSPYLSAANSGSKYVRNPSAFGKDETKFFQRTASEHSTMLQMAEETGGHAFINTNGLSEAVGKAIEAGSNYYTIAYTPTSEKWDGRFRKIQVRLAQQGFTLSYRRGYYADNPDAPARHDTQSALATAPGAPPAFNAMRTAMMRGAPDPTQILFKASVVPTISGPEDTLAPNNALAPAGAKIKPPYRRFNIDYAADPRPIRFTVSPQGNYEGQVQFIVFVYDQDGQLISSTGSEIHTSIPPASFSAMLRTGIQFHQQVSIPVKGNYYLRIGVHDIAGDHVGAIEVPVASVTKLPPADASLPAPAKSTMSQGK
jgi:VWFA-related protein